MGCTVSMDGSGGSSPWEMKTAQGLGSGVLHPANAQLLADNKVLPDLGGVGGV